MHALATPGLGASSRSPLFLNGYDAMAAKISGFGWTAARDAFNAANPPGAPWTGSQEDLQHARGQYQALCDSMPRTNFSLSQKVNA